VTDTALQQSDFLAPDQLACAVHVKAGGSAIPHRSETLFLFALLPLGSQPSPLRSLSLARRLALGDLHLPGQTNIGPLLLPLRPLPSSGHLRHFDRKRRLVCRTQTRQQEQ
jgi:hypothetical protein